MYGWTAAAVILSNRRFLWKILPVVDTLDYSPKQPPHKVEANRHWDSGWHSWNDIGRCDGWRRDDGRLPHNRYGGERKPTPDHHPQASPILQRSTRSTGPPRSLSPQIRGLTHDYPESIRQVTIKCWYCGHRRGNMWRGRKTVKMVSLVDEHQSSPGPMNIASVSHWHRWTYTLGVSSNAVAQLYQSSRWGTLQPDDPGRVCRGGLAFTSRSQDWYFSSLRTSTIGCNSPRG